MKIKTQRSAEYIVEIFRKKQATGPGEDYDVPLDDT